MQLLRKTEIAIDMMVACAACPDEVIPTSALAKAGGTTQDHAVQIIAWLKRLGLLQTRRGRVNGGILLAAPPETLRIGAVLQKLQPELAQLTITETADGMQEAFRRVIDVATRYFLDMLDEFTIADLATDQGPARIACLSCDVKRVLLRMSAANAAPFSDRIAAGRHRNADLAEKARGTVLNRRNVDSAPPHRSANL